MPAALKPDRSVQMNDLREPTELINLGVAWISIDVRDQAALTKVFEGENVVFYLAPIISIASFNGGLEQSVNRDDVKTIDHAALATGVPRFVYCSPPVQ